MTSLRKIPQRLYFVHPCPAYTALPFAAFFQSAASNLLWTAWDALLKYEFKQISKVKIKRQFVFLETVILFQHVRKIRKCVCNIVQDNHILPWASHQWAAKLRDLAGTHCLIFFGAFYRFFVLMWNAVNRPMPINAVWINISVFYYKTNGGRLRNIQVFSLVKWPDGPKSRPSAVN